ncbi:MAG: hypothetical protein F6J95_011670 [Leptolyngbya sp. SIO1E4]|nr:hypothetical protein [Leptolyngbya sp. SIO1E4]
MRLIHCETYQGAIAAAHVEFPNRELYGSSEMKPDTGVISPVVIDQLGETTLLPPVRNVDEAIAAARAEIERKNRSYIDSVIDDRVPAANAVQHFEDCGIPLELVPPLATERPYNLPRPSTPMQCLISQTIPNTVSAR